MTASLLCLALTIYLEAATEPEPGQFMVAAVVMNRVEDDRYPDTVCEVVSEVRQFSAIDKRRLRSLLPVTPIEQERWDKAVAIAGLTLQGWSGSKDEAIYDWGGATHYANKQLTRHKWTRKLSNSIGNHHYGTVD